MNRIKTGAVEVSVQDVCCDPGTVTRRGSSNRLFSGIFLSCTRSAQRVTVAGALRARDRPPGDAAAKGPGGHGPASQDLAAGTAALLRLRRVDAEEAKRRRPDLDGVAVIAGTRGARVLWQAASAQRENHDTSQAGAVGGFSAGSLRPAQSVHEDCSPFIRAFSQPPTPPHRGWRTRLIRKPSHPTPQAPGASVPPSTPLDAAPPTPRIRSRSHSACEARGRNGLEGAPPHRRNDDSRDAIPRRPSEFEDWNQGQVPVRVPVRRSALPWPWETHAVGTEPDRCKPRSTRRCLGEIRRAAPREAL